MPTLGGRRGMGRCMAMEVGALLVNGGHVALRQTHGARRGARLGGRVRADCVMNWAMVLEAKLCLS